MVASGKGRIGSPIALGREIVKGRRNRSARDRRALDDAVQRTRYPLTHFRISVERTVASI